MKISRLFYFLLIINVAFASSNKHPVTPLLRFEENKNQWESNVLYRSRFFGGQLFLERTCLTYMFYQPGMFEKIHPGHKQSTKDESYEIKYHTVKVNFLNANLNPAITASESYPDYSNYFIGNDKSKWASNVLSYQSVTYHNLLPHIDLKLYSDFNNVKYDFVVEPKGITETIKMLYDGADKLQIINNNLIIYTSVGEITEQKPYAYQNINGKTIEVACMYVLNDNVVSFDFPKGYNKNYPLIIDPTLVFSTFTGSTADNWGMTATYDDFGNAYTGGVVFSFGYPTSAGAYQTTFKGGGFGGGNGLLFQVDISITKFNPTGTGLLYSTYLGGSDNEQPQSLVVNSNNELLIYGRTYSNNFPTANGAYDPTYNGGADIVACKFNTTGTALLASTYIGGSGDDGVNISAVETVRTSLKYNYSDDGRGEIVVDKFDNIYIASSTTSNDFPLQGALQPLIAGLQDACVFKLNSNLSSLVWSTYLGGTLNDAGYGLSLDNSLNVYVAGGTESNNFPATVNTINPAYMGGVSDGYVTHIKNDGSSIIESSYIGTNNYDQCYFVQTDKNNNVYLYGQTGSNAYPVTPGVYSNPGGAQFVHKLNSSLSSTIFSTVFGTGKGTPDISPAAFLVDKCENVYASGWGGTLFGNNVPTSTTFGLPVTSGAFQTQTDGDDFYFLAFQKDATALLYATFFGGPLSLEHVDGGTSRFDKSGVIYQAICEGCGGLSDMPTSPGAWSATNNSSNCNNAVVKFDFNLIISVAKASASPTDTGCVPYTVNFVNNSTAANYTWDFGDATATSNVSAPSHTFNSTGTYTVTLIANDPSSCNLSDTTYISITVGPAPTDNLGNDTTLCGPSSIFIDAGNPGNKYLWSTGATTQIINVNSIGNYSVTVDNSFCSKTFDKKISIVTFPQLGNDTILCDEQSITLDAQNPGNSYLWSTDETSQKIIITKSGMYWVKTFSGNCSLTDTLTIFDQLGTSSINFPNSFTPNGDGLNEIFKGYGTGITSFEMKIFDRWGELICSTSEMDTGWDGRYKGRVAENGVYVYVANYKTTCTGDNTFTVVNYIIIVK